MKKVKPNLLIPGAAKSGTSSLHNYLNLHPDIFMSSNKEPHFFSHDIKFSSKIERDKYYKLFENSDKYKYRGESSTGYMVFPNTIERIKKDILNPKLIFVLRNPIDRIFSHYNWVDSLIGEKRRFKEAIIKDMDEEPNVDVKFKKGYRNYYQFGLYGKWLEKFYKNFDKSDILIILTEDLRDDPLATLNKCCEFLSIEKFKKLEKITDNKTIYYKNPVLYNRIVNILNPKHSYQFIKSILPHNLSNFLASRKRGVLNLITNYFISAKAKKLTNNERKWLKELYQKDVELLKAITELPFDKWKDFN